MDGIKQASEQSRHGLRILLLSGITATFAAAAPAMAMPVLFAEIAEDLGLTLVQIGAIWGTASFAGLFTSLLGGVVGDRFGARRTLSVVCLLVGLAGASRGLSNGLASMTVTVFATGLLTAAIPMNLHKVCAMWYSGKRLGKANAVVSGGMAFGFVLGSLASATLLSPWLGGWRHVLYLYGGLTVLLSIPWAFMHSAPRETSEASGAHNTPSIRQALAHVAHLRVVWVLGIALLGIGGGIRGLLGYLPLYLRDIGWAAGLADGALAGFHGISLLVVFPLAMLSDRVRSRTRVLIAAAATTACGIGLLSVVDGVAIWIAVLLAGAVRDGFMSVFMTTLTEVEGVGAKYAGTALGLAMTLSRIGGLIAPPLGNSLAVYGPRTPFLLWAGMAVLGLAMLSLLGREAGPRKPRFV